MSERERPECPVCYSRLERTKSFAFPCGHAVCTQCNVRMVQTANNRCPTCRVPREGYNDQNSGPPIQRAVGGAAFAFAGLGGGAGEAGEGGAFFTSPSSAGRGRGVGVMFFRDGSDSVDLLGTSEEAIHSQIASVFHALSSGPSAEALGFLLNPTTWPSQQRSLPPGAQTQNRRSSQTRTRNGTSQSISRSRNGSSSSSLAQRGRGASRSRPPSSSSTFSQRRAGR